MRTNLKSYNKNLKSKRKPSSRDLEQEALSRYIDDADNSENFEVGEYPHLNLKRYAGLPVVTKIYDSSDTQRDEPLHGDMLLYMSRLAICFYNIKEGTNYSNVKVLMATGHGFEKYSNYITFQAFASASKRNSGVPVTFQTKIHSFETSSRPKLEIIFVRIKPHHKRRHTSEFDDTGEINERLSQVIETYTIDSSPNSLALYLCQYALASYTLNVLTEEVAKHDMESLKVLNLHKPVAKVPTYLITFEAHLPAETEVKCVEIFEIEVCMPSLFPTATIEFKSEAQRIGGDKNKIDIGASKEKLKGKAINVIDG